MISMSDTPQMPGPDDPRSAYATVTSAIRSLMDSVAEGCLGNETPCPEFSVKELLEHIVLVQRRCATVGRGEHWSTIEQEAQASGWAESFGEASHQVMEAWTDEAKLLQMFEVPWGAMPGVGILTAYTGELAVHGWDLAQATGLDFEIDDTVLGNALMGAKFIPAEGRDDPMMPFGPVVDPGPDASNLLQLAGWMGRDVLATAG